MLGLPEQMVNREPFPGPGLFIRIIGIPLTVELLSLLRWADARVREIVRKSDAAGEISQLVVALLGVRITGVTGDRRRYGFPIAIRAVKTLDFMTAQGICLPKDVLAEIQDTLMSRDEICGVFQDSSDKPPRTIEFE